MAFEQFKKDGRPENRSKHNVPPPHITITLDRNCYFSAGTIRKYELDRYHFTLLYFDAKKNRIGFKMLTKPEPYALKMAATNQMYGFSLSLVAAFTRWRLDPKHFPIRTFELKKLEKEKDFFFIDLNKPLGAKKDEAESA